MTSDNLFPFIKYSMFSNNMSNDFFHKYQVRMTFNDRDKEPLLETLRIYYPYSDRDLASIFRKHANNPEAISKILKFGLEKIRQDPQRANIKSLKLYRFDIDKERYKAAALALDDSIDPRKTKNEVFIYEEFN